MSYFYKLYDDYLMEDFARAFREYQLISDDKGREVFFRNFFVGEDGETLIKRNWNGFKRTCKELVKLGYYSSIVKFMYGVFHHGSKYNLAMLKSKLQEVNLPNGSNLAELCKNFYLSVQRKQNPEIIFPEDLDIYEESTEDYFDLGSYSPPQITLSLPEFLLHNIYCIDIDIRNMSKADIDLLVTKVIEIKNEEYKREDDYIKERNLAIEKSEKIAKGKMHLPRMVKKKRTEFDKRIMIPGALLDLFIAAELTCQHEICYYILSKYVWPTFSLVPWKQNNNIEVQFMGVLIEEYTDSIFSLEVANNRNLRLYSTNFDYTDNDFYKELIGNIDGALLKPGKGLYSEYPELGLTMAKTLSMGKEVIKREMPDYLYSFLMAFTPYVLYCCGYGEEAADFLLKNFDEINHDDKRNLYVQLILVRSILSSTSLEKASTLYGYYNYEMDRQAREKPQIVDFIEEIIRYIEDVKEYMELRNEATLDTNKPWVDVVFGDGKIMADVAAAKESIANSSVPAESLFKELMKYVEAFSYYSGVRLGVLGLPDEDGYDKLEGALSDDLVKQGQGIVSKMDEYLAYYQSLNHLDIRKNVNVFLQQHISSLMDGTINESIKAINALRLRFLGESIGSEQLEHVTEQMLSEIEKVINNLSNRLQSQYIGRTEIEMFIANLQKEFIRHFGLQVPANNLISLLPVEMQQECMNYIITSEIVFRMLSNRSDKKQLDFSPALIPLTKVLELLLNYVFQKMDVKLYPEINNNYNAGVRASYFDNSNKRTSIEFGPCIYLLCDGKIRVKNSNGNIALSWYNEYITRTSRFDYWGGNNVLDVEKLKHLKGLNIKFERSYRNPDGTYSNAIETASFNNDANYNRMLLAKGLEYIKNNYRNIVAHKDGVSLQTVEECRDILLQSESLLWVIIYILK